MKRGSLLALLFITAVLTSIASISTIISAKSSAECSDHIDNNGDGYCDAATNKGYCTDGSILGDVKCKNKQDSETAECIPSQEICDGIDNDCDGIIDDNLFDTRTCGSDIGACSPGIQKRKCYEGQLAEWGNCEGQVDPQPEICDGIDDNCNGVIDEACINLSTSSGRASNFGGKPGGGASTKATCIDSDGGFN